MKANRLRRGIIATLVTLAGACSSTSTPSGTGGHSSGGNSATGGSLASGGSVGSGGTSSNEGSVASGGTTASGGSDNAGGTSASGGTTASGGTVNIGGMTASGGTVSAGGAGAGGATGTSAGGSSGTGGTAGAGGTAVDVLDSGADSPDGNFQDAGTGALDGSRWSDWNAFFPLASGSTNNGDPGTTEDVSGHDYSASYGSGVTFSNSAMVLSGSGNVAISPKATVPVVDLTGSYSVSVWLKMTDTSDYRTFVSADGSQVSEFYLQKRADTGYFAFTLSTSDSNDGVVKPCVASASSVPDYGALYHLVATRDATTGLDTLYVNGVVAGTATCLASDGVGWAADTFGIGHGMYNGAVTDYFSGSISGVGLLSRALTSAEVAALYALGPG